MTDSIPNMIIAHVRHKHAANGMQNMVSTVDSDADSEMQSYETEKALIRRVLSEQKIGLGQKERIATAILRGEFDIRNKIEPEQTMRGAMRKVTQKTRPVANSLRHEHKFTPLELQSATAPIYSTHPKSEGMLTDRSMSPNPRRNLGPLSPMHPPKEKVIKNVSATTEYMRQAAAQAKEDEKQRTKQQIAQLQQVIQDQKIAVDTRKRNEVIFRRKLAAFRQKLFERLRERRDPHATDIMRCIDDNTIIAFMQRFKGCAMSTDAVLQHLGMCVKPTVSEVDMPEAPSQPEAASRDEQIRVHPRPGKTMGSGFRRPISRQKDLHLSPYNPGHEHSDGNHPPRSAGSFMHRSTSDMFYRDTSRPVSPSDLSIKALRSQMMVEGCLPSLQPEVALSDANIQALAMHTTTFENISLSVQRNPPPERQRVQNINSQKPPRSLKTKAAHNHELDHSKYHDDPEYNVFKKSDSASRKKKQPHNLTSTDYAGLYVITSAKLKTVMDL